MLFLHFLRIRARMSWPVSSMASSKSAWVNKMPLIFGPVLLQSGNCFSPAGLLIYTDTYFCGNQSFRMDYLLVHYFFQWTKVHFILEYFFCITEEKLCVLKNLCYCKFFLVFLFSTLSFLDVKVEME